MENGKAYLVKESMDVKNLPEEENRLIRKTVEKCPPKAIIIQES